MADTTNQIRRTFTDDEMQRVFLAIDDAEPGGRTVAAIVECFHLLLGVDEITEEFAPWDYALPKSQVDAILNHIGFNQPAYAHLENVLLWANKGPSFYEE